MDIAKYKAKYKEVSPACLPLVLVTCLFVFCLSCASLDKDVSSGKNIGVRWELATNFTDAPNVFEARFTLKNKSTFDLDSKNWALFFNMAPRPILQNKVLQKAIVEHINGD